MQLESIGGSHAGVDLIALANGQYFTLPAMRRDDAHQADRTRFERPTQGATRF